MTKIAFALLALNVLSSCVNSEQPASANEGFGNTRETQELEYP